MTISDPIQIILNKKKPNHQTVNIEIIKSPMKYEILELLRHNEMYFEDIVKNTSKSKASVSMHLRDLRKEGIVSYKADLQDNRKKIFYLKGEKIAILQGITIRIEADSPISDLELIQKEDEDKRYYSGAGREKRDCSRHAGEEEFPCCR